MFRPGLRAFTAPFRPLRPRIPQRAFGQRRFGYRRFNGGGLLMRWVAGPTFYRDVGLLSVGAAGVYTYNLEEVPITGRRRFNIVGPELEARVGQYTVDEIKQQYRAQMLPDWDPRVVQVKKVMARLVPFAERLGLHDTQWEVSVIESPEANAFVVPGGKVFVFTGILPLCRDEDGIAAVLGHEIAHVVAHHTAEAMSRSPIIIAGMIFLAAFDLSLGLSRLLLDAFLTWPASRTQEAEADHIGLMMMAQGCYRPEAAMEFWSRMESSGQHGPPQILSTHPSHHNREEKIRELLPQAHEQAAASDCHALSDYISRFSAAFDANRW